MKERIFPVPLKIYQKHIYRRVENLRGAGRLRYWLNKLAAFSLERYGKPKKTVLDEDWDILIIIDACRYDLFVEWLGEKCDYRISVASSTLEWVKQTFKNRDCGNIVYVSGNPYVSDSILMKVIGDNPFFYLEPVWDWGWNERLKTVPPWNVTKSILKLRRKFPEKKFIVHYLQPHHPFIGRKKITMEYIKESFLRLMKKKTHAGKTVWDLFMDGWISKKDFWEAYLSNLELVMKYVKKVVNKLNGRIVITSDHGNHLGEAGIYGHPSGLRTRELVKVPWYVLKE